MNAINTPQLLSDFARLLNTHGPDSLEAEDFIRRHSDDSEFVELARLSATLKRALTVGDHVPTPALKV
jgi:hypothetical protein